MELLIWGKPTYFPWVAWRWPKKTEESAHPSFPCHPARLSCRTEAAVETFWESDDQQPQPKLRLAETWSSAQPTRSDHAKEDATSEDSAPLLLESEEEGEGPISSSIPESRMPLLLERTDVTFQHMASNFLVWPS